MNHSNRRSLVAVASLVGAILAAPAFAQMSTGRHHVTGFIGGQFFDVGSQFDDFGANLQKEASVGARYQYDLTSHWALEGSFLYTPANAELARLARRVSVDTSYYNGNVVYSFFPGRRVVPYVTGGGGGVTLDVQGGGDTETYFGGNFGGGVVFPIAEHWEFRFDARDYVYKVDDLNDGSVTALDVPSTFDETVHDLSFNFGVSLRF